MNWFDAKLEKDIDEQLIDIQQKINRLKVFLRMEKSPFSNLREEIEDKLDLLRIEKSKLLKRREGLIRQWKERRTVTQTV